ncbi:efflux RND transporter periplasmic adaptor subunit [Shewanella maritima]|uniref:efflux RND transporter periplasmic adaptor subunit n=1 Tax=Shewanella maritima TaxID=2520507 RepID=UPI003736270C
MTLYQLNKSHHALWYVVALLFLVCPLLANSQDHDHSTHDHSSKAHTVQANYYCPMHPEVTSHEEGRCPKCNMFLVKDESDTTADKHAEHAHTEQAQYYCPMHPEVTSHEEGRCPKCNMFLVKDEEGHDHQANKQAADVLDAPKPSLTSISDKATESSTVASANSSGEATIKYVCPMHPHIVSDEPSTCPICGMNLEVVEMGGGSTIEVNVSGGMQQALGIRSQAAENGTLWKFVSTIGTVEYNQNTIGHAHTRVTGWIETLHVHNVGQRVKKGQLVYELYSPELINAQDDYTQAIDYLKQDTSRGQVLLRKARQRLSLLGVSDATIAQLEKTGETVYRIPFYAEQDGFISELNVRHGMYVQPGDTLFEIVDQRSVWVIAEVFENEQSWLEEGRPVEVSAKAQGLFDIESTIDFIYPQLDPVTRAMQVRIELDNSDKALKPGTLVDVKLFGGPKRNVVWIPTEALIQTGRENRVVVQQSDDSFASVNVKIGMISQGRAEIIEGIEEGDKVIISGQFLLDSEASIQGSLQRLSQPASDKTDAHQHH